VGCSTIDVNWAEMSSIALTFSLQIAREQRANERTRTADLTSLRVIIQVLQGCAGDC
jgi:hypothetical protein